MTAMRVTQTLFVLVALLIAVPAGAQDPYTAADDTWISLSGTVESVTTDAFMLDYGEDLVTVEMDDWDMDADAYKVAVGDRVTVNGMVDDDLFETTTIEASSVYVDNLNTYFYASAADEEDPFITVTTPPVVSAIVVQGIVTDVDDEEFTIDTGLREIRVETDAMYYDPLDDEGFQQIDVGDRVSVTGNIDDDFFEGRELVASSITTLSERP
jgi:uncharacterized protein YdeI (BOF family)